jgi:hypothetical protein
MPPLHQQFLKKPFVLIFQDDCHHRGMSEIPIPSLPADDPDRFVKCRDAVHIAFQELADRAARPLTASWSFTAFRAT